MVKDKDSLSAEKLRKRRIANFKVSLNDDGLAAPGSTKTQGPLTPAAVKIEC